MSDDKCALILNPRASGGRAGNLWKNLEPSVQSAFPDRWTLAETQYHRHAIELVQQHINDGYKVIVAIGGDGTISQVVTGYVLANGYEKGIRVGIIPAGTGGDFGRTLGVTGLSHTDAFNLIDSGEERTFDVGAVTFTDFNGTDKHDTYFINIASFGMSGETVYQVAHSFTSKVLAQSMVYTIMGVVVNLTYKPMPFNYKVTCDGDTKDKVDVNKLYFGAVCNARYFGGNMHTCPVADPTDGYLDFVLAQDVSFMDALNHVIPGLKEGKMIERIGPNKGHVEKVKVLETVPGEGQVIHLELDGESVGQLPATFSVKENGVRIMVPKGWSSVFSR